MEVQSITGIPGIQAMMHIQDQIYYKMGGIFNEKIISYVLTKSRETTHYDEVKALYDNTSFLEGVLGNVLIFEIGTDFMDQSVKDERLKGKWVHHSIILPLVSMNSGAGLKYVIDTNLDVHRRLAELEADDKRNAVVIVQANDKIRKLTEENEQLKANLASMMEEANLRIDAANDGTEMPPLLELQTTQEDKLFDMGSFGPIDDKLVTVEFDLTQGTAPNSLGIPLTAVANILRKADAPIHMIREKYEGKWKYLDLIHDAILMNGWADKVDESHWVSKKKAWLYTYRPTRANNKNKDKNLPVQLVGVTHKGLEKMLKMCLNEQFLDHFNLIVHHCF